MTRHPEVPPDCRLITRDSVGSTSEEAKLLATQSAPDRTVVWALEQTAGRGRHGRTWDSPVGNLYVSILLRPNSNVSAAPQIGFAVGAAMADAIHNTAGANVILKWPNDLLLDDRKVSGILLESADAGDGVVDWVVAGIGVNLASTPELPVSTGFPAGSLRASGHEIEPAMLLEAFLPRLFGLIDVWAQDGFAPVRTAWEKMSMAPGTPINVKLPDGTVAGVFEGIDEVGNMILGTPDGPVQVAVGDVFPVSSVPTGVS
ncbi:MAG: biotin--[acetyl-CoA-carboxylase] ligase [Alphaproteobacteria bacterium]|nr:biotin--[acetyl-CoA-carboxylase] ligase [Alphaproteobacteria bacterium]